MFYILFFLLTLSLQLLQYMNSILLYDGAAYFKYSTIFLFIKQVMPALATRIRPAEEGWSKPHIDDVVEKLFTATFPAFKFPDRERLHVSCGVQLCRDDCPYVSTHLVGIFKFFCYSSPN